ncbi:MAG TPA: chaperonin GroEL [Patescibacteria group bacterium]|nr:chaperonin GroEL [Patescibacteria group bacterium]
MAKVLKYKEEARTALLNGMKQVNEAVATTLGPKGRNVAIDKKWGSPSVVHDGVTVAKEVELEDPFENMGASLIKEAASKTNDTAGDGTTTSTILAYAITARGMKNITAGANAMQVKRGIDRAVAEVLAEIDKRAKSIKGKTEIAQVATISAGDSQIGEMIAEALEKVGKDGVVTVEEGKGLELEKEFKEGMEFDKGYASAYFVTIPERMEAEVEAPYILITDKKISAVSDILPFLENLVKVTKNFVVIADEVEGEALATLVVNKLRGTFNMVAVKAPGFGDRRKAILEDIAILTGGTVISEDTGRKLDSVTAEDCGQADKVWVDKDNCRVIGGKGDPKKIMARIDQIRSEIKTTTSDFDKEKLQERLAKLSGGVVQINVGAATEVEMKEKLERVKDAVEATKAAMESGIVPGGEITLLNIARTLDLSKLKGVSKDEVIGYEVVKEALEVPFQTLISNSGFDPGELLAKIRETKSNQMGFDVMQIQSVVTAQPVDLVEVGIVDPAKVVKEALRNGASVAGMVLTTECLICDKPEKTPPAGGAGMPAGMGGMGEY